MEPASEKPQPKTVSKNLTQSTISPRAQEDEGVNASDPEIQRMITKMQASLDLSQDLVVSQKDFEKQGKYLDADKCKKEIKRLRDSIGEREQFELKARHKREMKAIESGREEELTNFNAQWAEVFAAASTEYDSVRGELIKRHQEQIAILIETEKDGKLHESAELLNLRKIELELARQQNYLEAHTVQQQCLKLQKEEQQRWKKVVNTKDKSSLEQLKEKHDLELSALEQRHQIMMDEKQLQKTASEDMLKLKYANLAKELSNQQANEVVKLTKVAKLSQLDKKSKSSLASLSKINI